MFSTDLNQFKLHSLFKDFGAEKTFKFELCRLFGQHSQRLFQKINTVNLWQSSWGCASEQFGQVGLASTYTGGFRVSSCLCWSKSATCSLEEKCYHSCNTDYVKKVLMLSNFWAVTSHWLQIFFSESCEMKGKNVLSSKAVLTTVLQTFIIGTNPTCSKSNPMILGKAADLNGHSVWVKSLCSDSNQTAQQLQMAVHQKLEAMSGMIEMIETKVCSQNISKCNETDEGNVKTWIEWTSFDSNLEIFEQSARHLLKIIIYCLTDQPSITWSPRSVLTCTSSKFQLLSSHFSELEGCLMIIQQNLC